MIRTRPNHLLVSATPRSRALCAAGRRAPGTSAASWLALLCAAGCAQLEGREAPRVETSGPHAVVVGQSIQISAQTLHGADAGYDMVVNDPSLASIDASGIVTGVAPGETAVSVTGRDTGAVASHPVVVVAAEDGAEVPFYDAWMSSPHSDAGAEAFTHWSEDGAVPPTCARCHSSEGFIDYLGGDGSAPFSVERAAPPGSVVRCATCHDPAASALDTVRFPCANDGLPAGTQCAPITGLGPEARCMTCHQGRASTGQVRAAIAAAEVSDDDEVSDALGFQNIHYYPAAATLYAGKVMGGYQYEGEPFHVYDVRFRHVDGFDQCHECHDPHSTQVRIASCQSCHPEAVSREGLRDIRMIASRGQDYDGDGDTDEGLYYEVAGLQELLLEGIERYAAQRGQAVCYDPGRHPYFFLDTNGDGACAADEAVSSNRFASWTARLVRAAYNYQMVAKEPGAFAHNGKYVIQLLHDSIVDVNAGLAEPMPQVQHLVRNDVGHFNGASEAARHWDEEAEGGVTVACSRCHGGASGFHFFLAHGVGLEAIEQPNGLECSTCHTSFGSSFDVLQVSSTLLPGGAHIDLTGNSDLCGNCHAGRESKATLDAQIATGQFRFRNVHYMPAAGLLPGTHAKLGYEYSGKDYSGPWAHPGGIACTSCHDPVASNHTFRVADAWDARCEHCHADYDEPRSVRRAVSPVDNDGDGDFTEPLTDELQEFASRLLAAMAANSGDPGLCYEGHTYPYFFEDTDGDDAGPCSPAEATPSNGFTAWTEDLMTAAHNFQISQKEGGAWIHNFDYMAQLLYDSIERLGGDLTNLQRPPAN